MRLTEVIGRTAFAALIITSSGSGELSAKPEPTERRASQGVITAVDSAAKSFSCHWTAKDGKSTDWTYKTDEKTTFELNKTKVEFADVKVGETVQVKFHLVEKDRVADAVTITAP